MNVKTSSDGSNCSCDHGPKKKKRAPTVVIVEKSESSQQSTETLSDFSDESHRWAAIERR